MKKFLGKKPVWICFIVAAVIFLAVEIGILVRPISYGLNYTFNDGGYESTIRIHSDSVARMIESQDEEKTVMDMWIYRDGHDVVILGPKKYVEISGMTDDQIEEMNKTVCITKDQYKDAVKELKELKKNDKDAYKLQMASAINFGIFEAEADGEVAKCPQAIAFVVIHGVFTVALITFAVLSTIVVLKKKKA